MRDPTDAEIADLRGAIVTGNRGVELFVRHVMEVECGLVLEDVTGPDGTRSVRWHDAPTA